jgi:hypothetical protein
MRQSVDLRQAPLSQEKKIEIINTFLDKMISEEENK